MGKLKELSELKTTTNSKVYKRLRKHYIDFYIKGQGWWDYWEACGKGRPDNKTWKKYRKAQYRVK